MSNQLSSDVILCHFVTQPFCLIQTPSVSLGDVHKAFLTSLTLTSTNTTWSGFRDIRICAGSLIIYTFQPLALSTSPFYHTTMYSVRVLAASL